MLLRKNVMIDQVRSQVQSGRCLKKAADVRFKATDVKAADGVLKRPMFDAKRPMVGVKQPMCHRLLFGRKAADVV